MRQAVAKMLKIKSKDIIQMFYNTNDFLSRVFYKDITGKVKCLVIKYSFEDVK